MGHFLHSPIYQIKSAERATSLWEIKIGRSVSFNSKVNSEFWAQKSCYDKETWKDC